MQQVYNLKQLTSIEFLDHSYVSLLFSSGMRKKKIVPCCYFYVMVELSCWFSYSMQNSTSFIQTVTAVQIYTEKLLLLEVSNSLLSPAN